jgi:TolB-like protein
MAKMDSTSMSMVDGERLSSVAPAGGTLRYMSPEQVLGHSVSERSDLYALGVVLYEMATGRVPFDSESAQALANRIVRERPRPPRRSRPTLSARLELLILRLLRKDPAQRPARAAEVASELEGVSRPLSPSERARLAIEREGGRRLAAIGLIGVLALAGLLLVVAPPEVRARLGWGSGPIRSLAVLPLANLSGDAGEDFLADGMTDELITSLAQIGSLKVISRSSVLRYRNSTLGAPEIGRQLGVEALVEGSIARIGDRIRVTTQLVRAETGEHLWARSYDRPGGELASLRTDVAMGIANEVQARLSPGERRRLERNRPLDPAAYDSYLRGRYFANRTHQPDLKRALAYFEDATRRQPDYADAWAEQSESFLSLTLFNAMEPGEAYPKARAAADRALALDSSCVAARVALGRLLMIRDWNFPAAESHLKVALALNPGYSRAQRAYGNLMLVLGRLDESLARSRRSRDLDPMSIGANQNLAGRLLDVGRVDEGIEQALRTIDLDTTWADVRYVLAGGYEMKGMMREAAEQQILIYKLVGSPRSETDMLERALAKGTEAFWRAELERCGENFVNPVHLAEIHMRLGDHDRALDFLEKAYDTRFQAVIYVRSQPGFRPLHGTPRFEALLRKIGSPTTD